MKNKDFFNIEHARLYLIGSIIRIDGMPVVVEDIKYNRTVRRNILHYRLIEKVKGISKVGLSSGRVDMNPIPLGFINFREFGKQKVAIKAYRTPARQWRIGLTAENLKMIPEKYNQRNIKEKIMKSVYFKESVCGKFPKVEEIIKMIKSKDAASQAFNKNFAIEGKKLLFIQLRSPVGKLFKDEVMLFDDYLYLNQLLEKAICLK